MHDGRPTDRRPTRRAAALAAALFVLAAGWFHALGRAPAGFQVDEPEWIASGVHAWQLATTGRSVDEGATATERRAAAERPWRLGIEESTFGWMNPVLPKLAFGAAAAAAGVETTTRRAYERFQPAEYARPRAAAKAERGRFLPALAPARFVTTLAAAAVAVLLFGVVRVQAGAAGATAAYALWLASPTAREVAVYVRTGLFPLVFGLAALLVACLCWRELSGRRGTARLVLWALALGALCGLAVGSKLNGALVSFAVPLWLAAAAAGRGPGPRPPAARPLLALAVAALVCAALFWLALPGLWGEPPVAAVRGLLAAWHDFHVHMVRAGPADIALPADLGGRLARVFERTARGNEPLYALTGLALGVVAVPAGLAALAVAARRCVPARQVLAFVAVVATGTALWIPMDRARFYLPFVVLAILAEGALVGALARRFGARRAR